MPVGDAGITMAIDSAVSQLWLPTNICDNLASMLGLNYDNATGLYLVNATTRQQLLRNNPQFLFTLGVANGETSSTTTSTTSNATTNIALPYSALDAQIGFPIYSNATYYFPIRRAADQSQYVLGRAFLQEAYLAVDWTRGNFTLAQSLHPDGVTENITPILAPASRNDGRLSGGAIAGIVIGAVAGLALLALAGFFLLRRRRRRQQQQRHLAAQQLLHEKDAEAFGGGGKAELPAGDGRIKQPREFYGDGSSGSELMSSPLHEMESKQVQELDDEGTKVHEIYDEPVFELPGDDALQELEAGRPRRLSISKGSQLIP